MDAVTLGLAQADAKRRYRGKPGTRRAAYGISNANGLGSAVGGANDKLQRIPIKLPVTTTRWRFRWRNAIATASGWATNSGAVTFNGVWIGLHATNAYNVQAGQFTAAPTAALPGFVTDATGAEYASPWVTATNAQFTAYTDHLLSMGLTCATSTAIASAQATTPWLWEQSSPSQYAGAQTAAGINQTVNGKTTFGDCWVEYEYVGDQPVVLVAGDSRSAGYAPTGVGVQSGANWPNLWALKTGVPVICAAISGATTTTFSGASSPALSKFGIGTTIFPDFAHVDLGINDFGSAQDTTSVQTNVSTLLTRLRAWGISRISTATMPGVQGYGTYPYTWSTGTLVASVTAGATTITTSAAFKNNDIIRLDYGQPNADIVFVSGASTGTAGNYTTNLSSGLPNAHAAGALIVTKGEWGRREFNAYLRANPLGFSHIIDNEKIQRDATLPYVLDADVNGGDGLHLNTIGQRRYADAMPERLSA